VPAHKNAKPDGPLTVEQRNALLEAWLGKWPYPLAYAIRRFPGLVRQGHHLGFTADDMNAACLAAGVNAARLFDPARGVKFTSFVCWHLRAGVERLIGRDASDERKRGGAAVVSLSTPVRDRKGNEDDLSRVLPAPESDHAQAERVELAETLWAAVCRHADKLCVELRYGLNGHERHTLEDIGRQLGVSKEAVRQRLNKVMRKCRPDLEELYHGHCLA
jgi:DNA-directed RNA polymerase sigma subunit (sigma70/sigma32)